MRSQSRPEHGACTAHRVTAGARSTNRVVVIFPHKEVEVGTMNPGDHLVVREIGGPHGRDWIAFIEAAGQPDPDKNPPSHSGNATQ
jgi:hypothetical protein